MGRGGRPVTRANLAVERRTYLGARATDRLVADISRAHENYAAPFSVTELAGLALRWRASECHAGQCVDHSWVGRLLERLRQDGVWSGDPLPVEPLIDGDGKYANHLLSVRTRWGDEICDTACIDHIWVGRLLRFYFGRDGALA